MGKVICFLVNLGLSALWLWVFAELGWIAFTTERELYIVLGVSALIAWGVLWLAGSLYTALIMGSCGLGCVLLPVYMVVIGIVAINLTGRVTGFYTIEVPFWWQGLVMSLWFAFLRVPEVSISYNQGIRRRTRFGSRWSRWDD